MINFETLFFILIVHYIADFVFQTNDQALNKSTSSKYLAAHVFTYSLTWFFAASIFLFKDPIIGLSFACITYGIHFLTDFITSRIVKHFFDKKDFHNGFCVIGIDQILHYVQLFLTYEYLAQHFKV